MITIIDSMTTINLNRKVIYHLDTGLRKFLSKKTNWIVLTLPAWPVTTSAVNVSGVDCLEKSYPGLGIDKIAFVFRKTVM